METNNNSLYIPLQFWFNANPGLAIPLIALQYHDVKIDMSENCWKYRKYNNFDIECNKEINDYDYLSMLLDNYFKCI